MTAGLLTGAEPTAEAYDACFVSNFLATEEPGSSRHESTRGWMTRDFFRSNNGRDWRLITNW